MCIRDRNYYEQALDKSNIVQQEQSITLDLADVLLKMDDFSRSQELVQKVLDESVSRSPVNRRAEELIGRIKFANLKGY